MNRQFPYRQQLRLWYGRKATWLREPMQPGDFVRDLELHLRRIPRKTVLRVAEDCLWVVAITCLSFCSVAYGSAAIHQAREKAILEGLRATSDNHASGSGSRASKLKVVNNVLLGLIEIPKLDTAAIVEEGIEGATLWKAVGHVPGTAFPGEAGNAVLAAHRDTYFSGLNDLRVGDLVSFKSPTATYSYRVESMRIVEPDDAEVLSASQQPTLTLVTCYPFNYIGSAPLRYVVTAREEGPSQ